MPIDVETRRQLRRATAMAASAAGGSPDWADVQNKPSTFTPSTHSHGISDVTGLQTALDGKQASGSYASSTHGHTIADVTGLQTALDGKQASGSYAAATHTHAQSEVTGLVTALAGKAASSHTHAQSDITNLTTDLAAKQATLVSGTNIKTVNGNSLLGSGDVTISAGYNSVTTLASPVSTAANTTPVTLTGLVFSYAINSIYFVRVFGTANAAANTTGMGLQFDVSAAVTQIAGGFFHQLANTGTLSGGSTSADDASLGVSSGVPTNATDVPFFFFAMIRTGANTGTAQLRLRSETTAAITVQAGTTMVVEKVA